MKAISPVDGVLVARAATWGMRGGHAGGGDAESDLDPDPEPKFRWDAT